MKHTVKTELPACHQKQKKSDCSFKSSCSHSESSIVFWFDGIIPPQVENVASPEAKLNPHDDSFSVQHLVDTFTPPPRAS